MSQSRPSFLQRLLGRDDPKASLMPLYHAVVAEGRQPHWYLQGGVPDTLDGRFDMIVAILAQALMRLEALGAAQESVWLTELFVDDMDALGGRLAAYRAALTAEGDLEDALRRNLYRGEAPSTDALAHVEGALRARWTRLACLTRDALLAGDLG
jgi:cytochrome b pre-mRNA-processing protein 3